MTLKINFNEHITRLQISINLFTHKIYIHTYIYLYLWEQGFGGTCNRNPWTLSGFNEHVFMTVGDESGIFKQHGDK